MNPFVYRNLRNIVIEENVLAWLQNRDPRLTAAGENGSPGDPVVVPVAEEYKKPFVTVTIPGVLFIHFKQRQNV